MGEQTYKHIFWGEIIKGQKVSIFIWILSSVFYGFIQLLYPMMLGKILDAITVYRKMDLFVIGAVGYMVVFVVDKTIYVLVSNLHIIVREKITVTYRSKILERILRQEGHYEEGMSIGKHTELVLHGSRNIFEVVFLYKEIMASILKSIIILFVMARIDIFLFLGAVIWLPFMFYVSKGLGKILKRRSNERQKVYQEYRGWLIEVFKGIPTIQKYNMCGRITSCTQEKELSYQNETKKSEYTSLGTEFVTQLMLNLLNVSIYVLAAILISRGKLTIGSYIMVFEYYYMIQSSITKINTSYSQIKEKDIITEGAAYLPELMRKLNISNNRYISITPTRDFQISHYKKREWISFVLEGCSDKEKAFSNWMERDILFAKEVQKQCIKENYVSIINDGSIEVDEYVHRIAVHFGLY